MNTKMSKLVVAMAAMVMAGGAWAQSSATASADAKATVVAPLTIAKATGGDLSFGNINAGTAGTVVLAAATAGRTVSGGVALPATTGTVSAAAFDITGQAGFTYAITLPSSATITNGLEGDSLKTMTVDAFTVVSGGTGSVNSETKVGTLTEGGAGNLKVGATLNVGANQAAGNYTGSFSVTVAYN